MFEKRETETENEECVIEVYTLHLGLKNWSVMSEKNPCRGRIQANSNLGHVVIFWLIHKNSFELEIIYIRDYL